MLLNGGMCFRNGNKAFCGIELAVTVALTSIFNYVSLTPIFISYDSELQSAWMFMKFI